MNNYLHIIVGTLVSAFALLSILIIQKRKSWPEVAAKVVISRVCEEEPVEFKANTLTGNVPAGAFSRRSKSMKMHATYSPYLLYQYEFDGSIYKSKNMYSGLASSLDNNILRFFSEGSFYPARYNPNNPSHAYLMFSPVWRYYLLLISGTCIAFYPEVTSILMEAYAKFVSNK